VNFPIVLKTPAAVPPNVTLYYEVAENGVFQVRDTPIYRAVTRAERLIPGLQPQYPHVELRFPRLPRGQVQEVLAFFAQVYRRYGAEAVVIVFYRASTREFQIGVPTQVLPGRRQADGRWRADHGVVYGGVPRPQGFVRLGTIHSHGDLPAYSSGIDCADEQFEDGLHIVFGDFGYRRLSIAASFVANGARFSLAPADVLEPCLVPDHPARPEWMARVKRERDVASPAAPPPTTALVPIRPPDPSGGYEEAPKQDD
jgi:hypothetical protein